MTEGFIVLISPPVKCQDIDLQRNIGQGETPHRKHKRPQLGGGHLYDRSSV
jgi:hypothetical protein